MPRTPGRRKSEAPLPSFTLIVRNYRGLRNVVWRPQGVCALVGPNGSGKTTLIECLDLLRASLEMGLGRALELHGGLGAVRFFGADKNEDIELSLQVGDRTWALRPQFVEGVGFRSWERVAVKKTTIISRQAGADMMLAGRKRIPARDVLAFAAAIQSGAVKEAELAPLMRVVNGFRAYGGYDIRAIRQSGSPITLDRKLSRTGTNVFNVLRLWRDRGDDQFRFEFVMSQLRTMFPRSVFVDMDLEQVAQSVTAQIRVAPFKELVPLSLVPDGLFVALLHLTAIASSEQGGALSIDEPENALHPAAIRQLIEAFRWWSEKFDVTVLLATHSPVLLDTFREEPHRLFVMDPDRKQAPVSLDKLKTPNWLAHFSFGDLYAHGEYGAQFANSRNQGGNGASAMSVGE